MSVLIKGIEMPKSGTYICIIENNNIWFLNNDNTMKFRAGEICEVSTPHGRLIDASQFEVFGYDVIEGSFDDGVAFVLNRIDDAPTVIEEEE